MGPPTQTSPFAPRIGVAGETELDSEGYGESPTQPITSQPTPPRTTPHHPTPHPFADRMVATIHLLIANGAAITGPSSIVQGRSPGKLLVDEGTPIHVAAFKGLNRVAEAILGACTSPEEVMRALDSGESSAPRDT